MTKSTTERPRRSLSDSQLRDLMALAEIGANHRRTVKRASRLQRLPLGGRVQALREMACLSMLDLARLAKSSPSTICRLESGEIADPKVGLMIRLAGVFRVSVDFLIGYEHKPRRRKSSRA